MVCLCEEKERALDASLSQEVRVGCVVEASVPGEAKTGALAQAGEVSPVVPSVVIVVDDEPHIQLLLIRLLEREGFIALPYSSTGDLLAACERHRPVAVITDIFMPGRDGLEVIGQLKKGCPGLTVLAMPGGGAQTSDEVLRIAGLLGAKGTFEKPLDLTRLVNTLRTVRSQREGATR